MLGLWSADPYGDPDRDDLEAVARDTGAVDSDGEPLVTDIGSDGGALDTGVIDLVRLFVEEVTIDVDVLLEDLPGDDGDATLFVAAIEALRAEPPDGAVRGVDRFDDVRPGTRVVFRIWLANESIPRGEEPLRYLLRVVLRGDGLVSPVRECPVQQQAGGRVILCDQDLHPLCSLSNWRVARSLARGAHAA